MLRGISGRQFLEWQAFAELEPFDDSREDVRASSIIAAMFEVRRDRTKRREPFTALDFPFMFGDAPERKASTPAVTSEPPATGCSWQEMKFMAQMIVTASR